MPTSRIPDRWEEYSKIGKRIGNSRFITFKVPMKEVICKHLEDKEKIFTPFDLLDEIRLAGLELGCIIDLTNTRRYYDSRYFIENGLDYEKIFVAGQETPSVGVRKKFFLAVDNFLEKNKDNDKLIGVHCTHGVNRSGYLVAWYLMDRMKYTIDEALKAIAEARGHPIEREAYLNELRNGKSTDEYSDSEIAKDDKQQEKARQRLLLRRQHNFAPIHRLSFRQLRDDEDAYEMKSFDGEDLSEFGEPDFTSDTFDGPSGGPFQGPPPGMPGPPPPFAFHGGYDYYGNFYGGGHRGRGGWGGNRRGGFDNRFQVDTDFSQDFDSNTSWSTTEDFVAGPERYKRNRIRNNPYSNKSRSGSKAKGNLDSEDFKRNDSEDSATNFDNNS